MGLFDGRTGERRKTMSDRGQDVSMDAPQRRRDNRRLMLTQLLKSPVLGPHLVDVNKGRIVQAHDLVLAPSDDGWYLAGIDRSPQAMLRRLLPRRGRPDLRRHAILDWKDVQPFVGHVPTAKLLMPLQRLRRLHPAQIADIVEDASHAEGQEIIEAVEGDPAFTADVFEELDTEHQVEFLKTKSNEESARLLERMA